MDGPVTTTSPRARTPLYGICDETRRWLRASPSAPWQEVVDRLARDGELARLVTGVLSAGRRGRADINDEINATWERTLGRVTDEQNGLVGEHAARAAIGRLVNTAKFVRLEALSARTGTAAAHDRAVSAAITSATLGDLTDDGGHAGVLEKLGTPARTRELQRLVGQLADAQRSVIEGRYGLGLRPGGNASRLGISALAESKRHASALAAVRRLDTRALANMRLHPGSVLTALIAARQALVTSLEATGSAVAVAAAAGALTIGGGVAIDLVTTPTPAAQVAKAQKVRPVARAAAPAPTRAVRITPAAPVARRAPKPQAVVAPIRSIARTPAEVRRRTTNEFEVGRRSPTVVVRAPSTSPRVSAAPPAASAAGQEFELGAP